VVTGTCRSRSSAATPYQEGYDASALPIGPEYRGVGYLYGYSDETPMVRTFLADGADAQKILVAARRTGSGRDPDRNGRR